jgi:hypothetical protein
VDGGTCLPFVAAWNMPFVTGCVTHGIFFLRPVGGMLRGTAYRVSRCCGLDQVTGAAHRNQRGKP